MLLPVISRKRPSEILDITSFKPPNLRLSDSHQLVSQTQTTYSPSLRNLTLYMHTVQASTMICIRAAMLAALAGKFKFILICTRKLDTGIWYAHMQGAYASC